MIEPRPTRFGSRFTIILLASSALGLGTIVFVVRFWDGLGPEPVYLGKNFSFWFDQVASIDYYGSAPAQSRSALDAIRAMGSSVVPFLAERARSRESGITRLQWLVRHYCPAVSPFVGAPTQPEYWENEKAVWCLGELGSISRTALSAITNSPVQYTRAPIFEAWAKIEPTNSLPIQELCKLMKSGSQTDRFFAALGLGHCNPASAGVIETLIAGLHDPDEEVRANSALSLSLVGLPARSALPDLQREALESTFPRSRVNSARAIWKIDPSQIGLTVEVLAHVLNGKSRDQWDALNLLHELGRSARAAIPDLEEFEPSSRESRHLRDELVDKLRSLPSSAVN